MTPPDEKVVNTPLCKHCHQSFDITDADMQFYETMSVPAPTWCPECRLMRKMAFPNEGNLYKNICSLCNKEVISYLHKNSGIPIACLDCFWGDQYDPLQYGIEYDENRSFFAQMSEMSRKVPHRQLSVDSFNENSPYIHQAGTCKNCYMIFHADNNDGCYYGYGIKHSKDCVDNHSCYNSELCYECIDVNECHHMSWCQNCDNCSDCSFCRDCVGCHDCFLSVGLRNKRNYFMNQELTPELYQEKLRNFNTGSYSQTQKTMEIMSKLEKEHTYKHCSNLMTENSHGDNLKRVKNAWNCFDCYELEDCKNCYQMLFHVKDCRDMYQFGNNIDHCYEGAHIGIQASNVMFSYQCFENISELEYCLHSSSSKNCFACDGLKKHQFCILNKQYSEEEYKALRAKIIEKMKHDGEWGEFFPISNSVSAYNETIAQQWYPKTREEVLNMGGKWQDELPGTYGKETISSLPDDIHDAKADIVDGICKCENCSKNYKIIPQELDYLYRNSLPLPRECFDCRRQRRFEKRNKRTMRDMPCHECGKIVPTTYAADFPGKICCEECYRKLVY